MNRSAFAMMTSYLWFGALLNGFMLERWFLLSGGVLYIWLAVWLFFGRREIQRFHWIVLCLPISYGFAALFAVDGEAAINELFRTASIFPMAILASQLTDEQMQKFLRHWTWVGAVLVIIGAGFGMFRNGRLESTFYYANALAIFLLVAMMISALRYIRERKRGELLLFAIHATGLWLTFSRTVWVLGVLGMIWLFVQIKVRYSFKGLAYILSVQAIALAAAMLIKRDVFFFLHRVQSIGPQASEFRIRLAYWQDGFRAMTGHWFQGFGGGGWNVILPEYRSQVYYVRFVHNHYMQLLLDAGLPALMTVLLLIALFLARSRQMNLPGSWKHALLPLSAVIVLHAGFDIDLSFPLIFGLLVILMSIPFQHNSNAAQISGRRSISRNRLAAAALALTVLAVGMFQLWLSAAYQIKQVGIAERTRGELQASIASLQFADEMLPWAASIHYELAKTYIALGNQTHDRHAYEQAKAYVATAVRTVPEQKLYSSLYRELDSALR